MKWITSADIRNWVNTQHRDCEENLPLLLRKLVFRTVPSAKEINFPAGDSVAVEGWDGRLETDTLSPFVPTGKSAWEIGTDRSAASKASKDYVKRSADPLGLACRECTFVFVTPRSWPKRKRWEAQKRADGHWRDVRVIAADELEQWLEQAPAVSAWLARHLGKVPQDVRDIEGFWAEWSSATRPELTTAMVSAGRADATMAVQRWLAGPGGIVEVQGDVPDEAIAFLYSVIDNLPPNDRAKALARCVVVESIAGFRACTQFEERSIIVTKGEQSEAVGPALKNGHHVFLAVSPKVLSAKSDIVRLPRLERRAFEEALRASGLPEDDARRHALNSGRSIPVLRRLASLYNALRDPPWATGETAPPLLPILFAGAWRDDLEGDRSVLEQLAGIKFAEQVASVGRWVLTDDAPLQRVGTVWTLRAPLDAWFLIARFLERAHLQVFQQVLQAVLTQTDPKYDLPSEKRWAAAMYGKAPVYSVWLREGLLESLVLLAVYGEQTCSTAIGPSQSFANAVVRKLLDGANTWQAWASLKDVMPLIAEAAPDGFLQCIEDRLSVDASLLREFMGDDGDSLFGECRHAGLLWALEGLAWAPAYLTRTVQALGGLVRVDPGGRWSNRPLDCLKDIFLPWRPSTYANGGERLAALDALADTAPEVAWDVLESYFSSVVTSGTHRLQWRDAKPDDWREESAEEKKAYVEGLLKSAAALACANIDNACDAIQKFRWLPTQIRDDLLTKLQTIHVAALTRSDRKKLFDGVREALHDLDNYGEPEARREADLAKLSEALACLSPDSAIDRVGWLFAESLVRLPSRHSDDYDVHEVALSQAREGAARELLDSLTVDEIIEFARDLPAPGLLGRALGEVVRDNEEEGLLRGMAGALVPDHWPALIAGYVARRYQIQGEELLAALSKRLESHPSLARILAVLYLGLPQGSTTWTKMAAHGSDVEAAYWAWATGYSRVPSATDCAIAIEKLIEAKRPRAALNIVSQPEATVSSALLQRLLVVLLESDENQGARPDHMIQWQVQQTFKRLYRNDDLPLQELASLEWPYIRLLKDRPEGDLAIHRLLKRDPAVFAEFVSLMYKRDDNQIDEARKTLTKDQIQRVAENAWHVLHSWHLVPGTNGQTVDEGPFRDWITRARELCEASKRKRGGDFEIAEILAHAPIDPDGNWPHRAMRKVIEELRSRDIESRLAIAVRNNDGVSTRALNEGGVQERVSAEKYRTWARGIAAKSPRSAAVLNVIADSYGNDARTWDIDAELNDLRW